MKRILCLALSVLSFPLAGFSTDAVDNRNFSIDTFVAKPNEVAAAQNRVRGYWQKNGAKYGNEPRLLAVQATKLFPSEIVQDLWPKLINSQTTGSFFGHGRQQGAYDGLNLKGILLWDTATGQFTSNNGYVAVDEPRKGQVARFGSIYARYIGTGK